MAKTNTKPIQRFKPSPENPVKPYTLILGDMPGKVSRDNGFYYMDNRNKFWEILDIVFETNNSFANWKRDYLAASKSDSSNRQNIKAKIEVKLSEYNIVIYDIIEEIILDNSTSSSNALNLKAGGAELKKLCENAQKICINGKENKLGSPLWLFRKLYKSTPKILAKYEALPNSSGRNGAKVDEKAEAWKVIKL